MSTLLNITSSLYGSKGQSSQLAERFIATWRAQHPNGRVTTRDLAAEAVPHLTAERFQAFLSPVAERSLAQQAILRDSDNLIEEWRAADTVVPGPVHTIYSAALLPQKTPGKARGEKFGHSK